MNEGLNNLWPTAILKDKVEGLKNIDILDKVRLYLLTSMSDENKMSLSDKNYNIFDDDRLQRFKKYIVIPAFKKYLQETLNKEITEDRFYLRGWCTGHNTNFTMPLHNHGSSHLSAVFYILSEDNNGGSLILSDPRSNANRGYTNEFSDWFEKIIFKPKTGDIIIFPSFLYHGVETYYGKKRLSIPVDLILKNE